MCSKYELLIILFSFICPYYAFSQAHAGKAFRIVPLGVEGGIDESNLSAYMVAAEGTDKYICLDAGTLYYGIEKAIHNKIFSIPAEEVIKKYIKGYFISHAHLDHVSGLIINSPDDSNKNIYASAGTIETLKTHYFTWESWANFTDEGETPLLKKYHYCVLIPDSVIRVSGTQMTARTFPLSHGNLQSTAFLVRNNSSYILYLGDTGPDEIEKSHDLHLLWQAITPIVKNKQLKAIFIETSYPDEQPDRLLFGHLTPRWLMKEMDDLANLTGPNTLKWFKIIITHNKPPQAKINIIKRQLFMENRLGLNLIFPQQGTGFSL